MEMQKMRNLVYQKLKRSLSPTLSYHGLHHTEDVVTAALELAKLEGINKQEELELLETAAWFHDLGFISTYRGHEEESCRLALELLTSFKYSSLQMQTVCGMIRATKIPQQPKSHLEEILADADLDYLGREDFYEIFETLFLELKEREMLHTKEQWNQIQIEFLSAHSYWTASAQKLREALKNERLRELKEGVGGVTWLFMSLM